ncbi:MAG: hypothetical protein COB30_010570 [Ectothiorhodospiraceae bacterium]|nr:hypothetical protein [Ectothiorhodospiraceae bacterium]
MKKKSLFCIAMGFITCLIGVFFYSVVGMVDKGLVIINVGFFVSAVGISVYLYTYSTAIGTKVFVCGFGIGVSSFALGDVIGMAHPLVVIISKIGVWVAITGAVIHIVNAVRMMRN